MKSDSKGGTDRHIIVGADGSANSADALRWAMFHAATSHTEESPTTNNQLSVHPVFVWNAPLLAGQNPMLHYNERVDAVRSADTGRANQMVQSVVECFGDIRSASPRVIADLEVLEGHVGATLLDRASDTALLVLGSRGFGALRSVVLGTVSGWCLSGLTAPTVIVPAGARYGEDDGITATSIVVGIDGSLASDNAAVWARHEFPDADITLRYCWVRPVWADTTITGGPTEFATDAGRELDRHVERISALVSPEAKPFLAEVVEDDARHGLTDGLTEGEGRPDLLVLGGPGVRGLKRAMFGSVAHAVAHHLAIPTAFVPSDWIPPAM